MFFLNYATIVDPLLRGIRAYTIEFAGMRAGDSVLDVCCGTGDQTFYYARAGMIATGIDMDPNMLKLAGKDRRNQGLTSASFHLGDAKRLPFKEISFDYASISFALHEKEKDATELAKSGVKEMQKKGIELILLDTSGRHREETGLIKEMKDISKAVKPQEIILVIDGTLGQQAGVQAAAFKKATDIGSIIVTKLDGSAKGGGALSAVAATQAPIKFIGVGEGMDAIEPFNPTKFAGRLLGMSDIRGLIDKVREAQIEVEEDAAKRIMKGQFSLKDMMAQMKQLKKMGPIGKVMEMLGLQYKLPEGMAEIQEENMKRWEVIMNSMTKEELEEPKLIKSSRIKRIASGSGTSQKDVRDLLKQHEQMKKMMKQMGKQRRGRRGQIPGIPGLDGL